MTLGEAARRLGGVLSGDPDTLVTGFATDNRQVQPGEVFIAIAGAKTDGRVYAVQAVADGASAVLAEGPLSAPSIQVPNLVDALAAFGRSLREEFDHPVVGITGSVGKTTTKEFTAGALAALGPVLKSEGNRNTEYTSPLTWFEMKPEHRSAVIEMGMRGFGQIAHLASICKPTIGLITQIGTSHVEKVGNRQGIFKAKGELLEALPATGTTVIWREDDFYFDLRELSPCPVVTYGFSQEADCRILGSRSLDWSHSVVFGTLNAESWEVELPVLGRHQALNAAGAITAAVAAGADLTKAAAGLRSAKLPPMRLQAIPFQGGTIILDTYNASPDSTAAALHAMGEMPATGRRLAVLGEMKELGDYTESGHRAVGRAVAQADLDAAILVGPPTRFIAEEAIITGFDAGRLELLEEVDLERISRWISQMAEGDVLLIKGSRALGLENALPKELIPS
jgi:UDP-N-acetylmuramoyl-tripeptide--D-alanyl-D-alanine ligase